MCKETPKTKSAFVTWSAWSLLGLRLKQATTVLFQRSVLFEERIPENILKLQCATEVAEIILQNDTFRYWST